jgi:hypothetical protein
VFCWSKEQRRRVFVLDGLFRYGLKGVHCAMVPRRPRLSCSERLNSRTRTTQDGPIAIASWSRRCHTDLEPRRCA